MQDTKSFEYLSLVNDESSLTHCEIKRVTYKTTLNKTLRQTSYMNKIMRKLVDDASKQVRSLFERCFRESIQLT